MAAWLFRYVHAEVADVHKMPGNGGRRGHDGADQVRAAAFALTALEVAIGGAGAALAGRQHVVVHGDAHAAAGLAPLESSVAEDAVESFLFGFGFDDLRSWND